MDLRFMTDEPSAAERAVIARVTSPVEKRNGQVVKGGHEARGYRHLLLPALAMVQSEMGWVSRGALNEISRRLLIPPAEAYGVASFYALISTEERPPVVRHVCDDIACRQAGGLELLSKFAGEDVVSSPCLGQCDRRPAMFIQRAGAEDEVRVEGEAPVLHRGPLLRRVGVVDPTSLEEYRASVASRRSGERGAWVRRQSLPR